MKRTIVSVLAAFLVAAPLAAYEDAATARAIFAGGCFWCMEPPFDALDGVMATTSGYIGGHVANPSYEQVVTGETGHVEAVLVEYDPRRISYERLLEVFWRNIDPTDDGGQFCDRGSPYRSAIFYLDPTQLVAAQASKSELEASERLPGRVVTRIIPAMTFYAAEDYHQDYYIKNPIRYRWYRSGCGRDRVLRQLWGS